MDTPLELCKLRNAMRDGAARVPDQKIDYLAGLLTPPTVEEGFTSVFTHTLSALEKQ